MNTLGLRIPALCIFLLSVISSVQLVSGQTVNRAGKPFPAVSLPNEARGAEIETALGTKLKDVAEWYGHSETDFKKLVKRDKDLKIDKKGRLHYVCPGPGIAAGTSTTWGNTGKTFTAPFPDAQTFLLHSKPGASKVIYLDFNGHTTSGMLWNDSFGPDLVTPAYDIDSNPASFSATELANIQVIWQSVVEDYAPFDVDVTTQDPGVEALRKTSPEDQYYGVRVCIGGSSFDWYGSTAGGVAYVGSFDWNTDSPVFVFPAQLGAGNPKFVAEAASHESGHSLGLHHMGLNDGTTYYTGQGSWAPIMGSSYYREITQWSNGNYTNANNTEDQLAIINGYLAYRPDTVGGNIASATALSGTTISTSGLIETTGEVDVFSFITGSGNVSLTAKAAPPSSGNLHLLFSLYDSNGATITTAGPSAADTGVSINTSLNAGTYYLAVNGVGSGDPLLTGFSNYDSIGQFSISGSVVPANNQAPTAVASNSAPLTGNAPLSVNFSSAGSSDPDGTVASYLWTFGDGTANSTLANPSHSYTAAGTYNATLVVKDNYGVASAPAGVTVTVQSAPVNQAPTAVASSSAPLTGDAPLTVNFSSAGSTDTDGTIASYAWLFGDGTVSSAANPSHVYTNAGTYTATLTVTDNQGATSAPASVVITVNTPPVNQAPVANAQNSAPLKGAVPLAVNFSSSGSNDPDGSIAEYNWSFGDGGTSTAANPAHTYGAAGNYTAQLTVRDNLGDIDTTTVAVHVAATNAIEVYDIAMSTAFSAGKYTAKATVTVKDVNGNVKSGATVKGNWSGVVSATGKTATTDATGKAVLTSTSTATAGVFTFTVTGLTLTNFVYDALMNNVSSASITPPPNVLSVAGIAMTTTFASSKYTAKATVTVVNPITGNPVSGASVKGNWTGATTATGVSATTDATGKAVLTSASITTPGTFTFTVTGITLTGYTYDATRNTISSASITPPPNVLSVSGIAMTSTKSSKGYTAKATVTVVNPYSGAIIPGASVKGNWSGATTATGVSATTGSLGTATFTSATSVTNGTFTFTVTGITLSGYTYDANLNALSTNSITPP